MKHHHLHVEHEDLCLARFHDEAAMARLMHGCREYLREAHGVQDHDSEDLASEALSAVWVHVREGEPARLVAAHLQSALDAAHGRELRRRRHYRTGIDVHTLRETQRLFGGDAISALIEVDEAVDVVKSLMLLLPVALQSLAPGHRDVIVHYYRLQACGIAPHDDEPPIFATAAEGREALESARREFSEALLREIALREKSGHADPAVMRSARRFLEGHGREVHRVSTDHDSAAHGGNAGHVRDGEHGHGSAPAAHARHSGHAGALRGPGRGGHAAHGVEHGPDRE